MNVSESLKAMQRWEITAKHIQQFTGLDRRTVQKFVDQSGPMNFSTENQILHAIQTMADERSKNLVSSETPMRATGT